MMGQTVPKYVRLAVLKHYCNSNEVYACVGYIVTIEPQYTEWNIKKKLAV
jgi:hypothetical protein